MEYPTPSTVHLGRGTVFSFAGFARTVFPGSGRGCRFSSLASRSLPMKESQRGLPHLSSLAQGLLSPSRSVRDQPQHLPTNLTEGLSRHSPNLSSSAWRHFFNFESIVYGTNTGTFTTFIFACSLSWVPSCLVAGPLTFQDCGWSLVKEDILVLIGKSLPRDC